MKYFINSYHSYINDFHGNIYLNIFFLGLFLFVWLLLVIALQAAIHEGGHLFFGYISGYRFTSFRLFRIVLVKENGKYRLYKYRAYGTSGQCLMKLGKCFYDKPPFILYTMGGVAADLIASAIAISLMLGPMKLSFPYRTVLLISVIYTLGSAILNGIPKKNGMINNDGTNLLYYLEDGYAVKSGLKQLEAAAMLQSGMSYRQMPNEVVRVPAESKLSNGIVAWHKMIECYYYMDLRLWKQALGCILMLENEETVKCKSFRATILAEKLFLYIVLKKTPSEIEDLYTRVKCYLIRNRMDLNIFRVSLAYELYKDNSEKSRRDICSRFDTKEKNYPYKGEAIFCRALLIDLMKEK